jgi:hypothetical protein
MTTSYRHDFMYINLLFSCAARGICEYPLRAKSFVLVLYPVLPFPTLVWRWQYGVSMLHSIVAGNDNVSMYDDSLLLYRFLLVLVFLVAQHGIAD